MDTREKIVAPAEFEAAIADGNWIVLAGTFDPLTAENAAAISQQAENKPSHRVAAFVVETEEAHLPAPARAALVAALRCVHVVTVGSRHALPEPSKRLEIVSNPAADLRHSEHFVQMVLERQKAEA